MTMAPTRIEEETRTNELDQLAINTLRFLAADSVQAANSGHPGLPLGAAGIGWTLWSRHLRHDPSESGVAGPGPLRALGRARLDAALRTAARLRLRHAGQRTAPVPPAGLDHPGAPRVRPHPRGRDHHRTAGAGPGQRRRAWPWPSGCWPPAATPTGTPSSITASGSWSGTADLMEGISHEAASLAGRLGLGKLDGDLRRQRHHHRRPRASQLRRRVPKPGSPPTAGACSASTTATTCRRWTGLSPVRGKATTGRRSSA